MSAKIQNLLHDTSEFEMTESIVDFHKGKTVLITGSGGSVGSELAYNLAKVPNMKLVLLDISEIALFNLENRLKNLNNEVSCSFELGDICDEVRMKALFEKYRLGIVYHAAAYKHVKYMEMEPYQAIKVNVQGTVILSDLSAAYSCDKFIFISTDKAVNPIGIMGASKRLAELYLKSKISTETHFVSVRFGNVLGSSGSLIPKLKAQIVNGGPVTLTHTEAERFFMSKSDACSLVLESGARGKNGEMYIFNVKESTKVRDVIQEMLVQNSNRKSIELKITGLLEGEKLKEELVGRGESIRNTNFSNILQVVSENQFLGSEVIEKLIQKNKKGTIYNYRLEIVKILSSFPVK